MQLQVYRWLTHLRQQLNAYRYTRQDLGQPHLDLASLAESYVTSKAQDIGVTLTPQPHNARFDFMTGTGKRVEIKASNWVTATNRKGRYQFYIHQPADLYILACCSHHVACFVIPKAELANRTHVAIWSEDPVNYRGQWAPYLENWTHLQ